MASKQYISIIRLFEHCGIATNDDFNLPRAKKQLQAEFGIAQSGFIEAGSYSYGRHDVLEELDNPDFLNRLMFHRQIWNSPQMLELLEKSTADLTTINVGFEPFWSNKKFDEFFSPYFQGPFNYISRTLLTGMRLNEMKDLLRYQDFLLSAEREEAFRPIRIFLDENMRLLRNTNRENYRVMRPKIIQWVDTEWHTFFNALPAEFDDIKIQIATRLVNIGVAIQKTFRRDCRKMSRQLIELNDTSGSLRGTIVSNHAIYDKSRFTLQGRNVFWGIWAVVAFIRLVGGSAGCNDTNDTPIYNTIKFEKTDTSLINTLQKEGIKVKQDSASGVLKYQE